MAVDGNRARRRRQLQMPNPAMNSIQQPPGGPNPQILNAPPPGQFPPEQGGQNDLGIGKQGGRQYYYPYQGQSGYYGSVQGLNYPYGGAGLGAYQYGTGAYGQYGGGGGGGYYNQYPGSNSFYPSYGAGSYNNRPGYSNYYPSSGSNMYGGYFWNAGHKQNINTFTVFLSSLLTLVIYLITI